jgi:hypothetical protein
MNEMHWTPEVISTQLTILQLISLFSSSAIEIENLNMIRKSNTDIIRNLLIKKGRLKIDKVNHE